MILPWTNKQLVFGVIAIVFVTALIASSVVDQASACKCNKQSISQHNHQQQSSSIVTAGANSPVTNSGNNAATATNTNNGGNAAAF
jgi:hypothetical protein